MTKRISQANTVVVPAVHAHGVDGKAVATKAVVVPADAEAAATKAVEKADEAPVTVVAEPVAALVAPAPMAMVAEPVAAAEPAAAAAASAAQDSDDDGTDLTPYIVGGVLILGGVLAVALSSGDTDPIPVTPAPANTAPNFTSALTATIAENAPTATIVYDANASDTQGNAIVFTIGGTDAALFNIDASTGVVTLRNSANFEAKPSYSFTVTATDNGTPALSATQTITVTVTNVNEAPAFASATATATVAENIPVSTVVFTASAPDPDAVGQTGTLPAGATVTYSLSGTDAAAFNINASNGQVTFRTSPDFETKSSYTFVVTATDGGSPALTSTQTVTITVTDVVETPPVFTSAATATIAENAAASTVVFDANATGATSFALSGADAAAFNFDTATGVATLRNPADFETKASYNVTVTATGAGGTTTQNVVVSVTNVNEAPRFGAPTVTATVAENSPSPVFQSTATDPDAGATVTYTLTGADAALFTVSSTGLVNFRTAPDFETPRSAAGSNVYSFNVVATDQGGLTATQAATVTVTDVLERAPTFPAASQTVTFNENGTGAVVTATATDPDGSGPPNTLTYTLTGADAALFTVSSTGVVTFRSAPDFEATPTKTVFNFNVVATDQSNLSATQAITVNLANVNEAPRFAAASQTATVAENSTSVILQTPAPVDPDAGDTFTYSLTGPDAALFNVSATGALTWKVAPNFEAPASAAGTNVYSVSVVATDRGGLSSALPTTVTVTNVNEAPVFTSSATAMAIAENGAANAVVYTAAATDPERGAVTYSLGTGGDNALFSINATTGAVSLIAPANFEAKSSYSFTVIATDAATPALSTSQAVTLAVTNVNEAPTFVATATPVSFAENGTGTVLTATATDPDAGAVLTYTLTGADAALFNVSSTGVVTFRAAPDFETPRSAANSNVYSFNVVATDQGNLSVTQAQTVTVTDVNEGVRIDGGTIPANTNTNFNAAAGNVTYLESGTVGNITTISNFTSGDIIQTDVATSNYSFSSVGTDLVISFLNNGVSTQITLTGAAGNNFIFNEASAEQAVGFDFFRSTIAPPPVATNTLTGNASYTAANAAVTYTDDATTPNISAITGFTSDDRIVATNANGGTYSFGSNGSDLVISFLSNGVSSQITLVGAANPNVFVFDEATAEQAVGFDFFRYG